MRRAARPRVSSAMSGFFFCGMIELPVANASSSSTQRELPRAPQHDLLGEPRQLHADHRRDEHELGDVIAAADGVDRVLARRVVAELGRRMLRLHARSPTRPAPRRRAASARARRSQSMQRSTSRAKHLRVRQQLVREHDRLRRLQMREAGRQRVDVPRGLRRAARPAGRARAPRASRASWRR